MADTSNTYQDLLSLVPTGSFYDPHSTVIPYSDQTCSFRLVADKANTVYTVSLNNSIVGTVKTDTSSIALVQIQLRLGDNTITLSNTSLRSSLTSYVTTKNWATWLASIADTLNGIDTQSNQLLLDRDLDTISLDRIDTVWGRRLKNNDSLNYPVDTYRELLQILQRAYRRYGGHTLGLMDAISAFTHINPLIYRRNFGPTWYLGNQFAIPGHMNSWTRIITAGSFPNITAAGASISVNPSTNLLNELGSSSLVWNGTNFTLTTPSGFIGIAPVIGTQARIYAKPTTLVAKAFSEVGPFNTSTFNTISLNIDNKGILVIALPGSSSLSATSTGTTINSAFAADARYGSPYNAIASVINGRVQIISKSSTIVIHNSGTSDASHIIFNVPWSFTTTTSSTTPSGSASFSLPLTNSSVFPVLDSQNTFVITLTTSPARTYEVKANNTSTNTLTLYANGDAANIPNGTIVSMNGQLPFTWQPITSSTEPLLVLDITHPELLSINTDTFTISGTPLPTGWLFTTTPSNVSVSLVRQQGWFNDGCLEITNTTTGTWSIQGALKTSIIKYDGFPIDAGVWVSRDFTDSSGVTATVEFALSYDNGVTWVTNSTTVPPASARIPIYVHVSSQIPFNCTSVLSRITTSGLSATGASIRIERVVARVGSHTALNMGRNTIPRNQQRSKRDYICYIWGPAALTTSEKALLGVPNGTVGHIDTVSPAHANITRFEVTELSGPSLLNVRGCLSGTDLAAGTSTNMSLQVRTPDRFSYLQPTSSSFKTGEIVIPIGSSPAHIVLSNVTDQDLMKVIVYENGIPIPQNQLTFTSANTIQFGFTPISGAVYTVDYQILLRYESIPLSLPGTPSDRVWFADVFHILGLDFTPQDVPVTVGIQFDANFTAALSERSDKDQSTSILYADDGKSQTPLDSGNWQYLSSQSIRIDPTIFNQRALYLLSYNARVSHPKPRLTAILEMRQGTNSTTCLAATYTPFKVNQLVNTAAFVQFRITYSNVLDPNEIRLYSVLLKGLNINGTGGTVPVLRDRVWVPHPKDGI